MPRDSCKCLEFVLGLSYNMSLCIYYLSIITFNKKDNYIRTKLEPWLHGIPIPFNLALCSAVIAINGYNSARAHCWFRTNSRLPHCWGLESGEIRDGFTIPCGRGDSKTFGFLFILAMSIILLAPVVIVVTMVLMYCTVRKAEKRMQIYGVGSLRLKKKAANKNHLGNNTNRNASTSTISPCGSPPAPPQENYSGNHGRLSIIQCLKANCRKIPCMNSPCNSERNNLKKTTIALQKRAILHRAVGYVAAWGLSFIPLLIYIYRYGSATVVIRNIGAIFLPLQGVFNFIAYMFPKVRNVKKGPTERSRTIKPGGAGNVNHANHTITSWRQAFLKAFMSRGPKKTSGQHHARTNGSSNGTWRSNSILNVLKKFKTSIAAALSVRHPMNKNSNDGVDNINQPQEIRPPVPCSGQGAENLMPTARAPPPAPALKNNNDYKSPAPTLDRNVYTSSPPLVLSEDADDLKEEGEQGAADSEEHHLNNNNDTENMDNEDMEDVLGGVYLSEEIQSILE